MLAGAAGTRVTTVRSSRIYRSLVPAGATVLELGSGAGDLLAALQPSRGSRRRHQSKNGGARETGASGAAVRDRGRRVRPTSASVRLRRPLRPRPVRGTTCLRYLGTLGRPLHTGARGLSSTRTTPPGDRSSGFAERLGLRPPQSRSGTGSRLETCATCWSSQVLTWTSLSTRILMPSAFRFSRCFLDAFVGSVPPFTKLWGELTGSWRGLCPSRWSKCSVTVVCPCRNEAGHGTADRRANAQRWVLAMSSSSSKVDSTDDTREVIERWRSSGTPTATPFARKNRVRERATRSAPGFAAAKHDVLMILDGDVSVQPEDLPKFYDALVSNRGEDGSTGRDWCMTWKPGSMRFLNILGTKRFRSVVQGDHRPPRQRHALRDECPPPRRLRV